MAWPADKVNRPIFCGTAGELTTTPPQTGVLQQVGSVYDTDAVYINLYPPIILDNPYNTIVVTPPTPLPGMPVAAIGVSPSIRVGQAPFIVNFVNASTGGPFTAVEWDFTNDGNVDSLLSNPQYTFTTAGTYNVRLRVTNATGSAQVIEPGYITVQPASPTTGFTNLEVRFVVDGREDVEDISVKKGQTFGVKLRVKNDGLLTATTVQRVFIIYDVANQQVQMVTPPTGATVSRGPNYTLVTFLPIATMAAGSMVDFPPFVMRAPTVGSKMQMEAAVSSPEADSTTSDNIRALTVKLTT
jgi:PKD repeat protein